MESADFAIWPQARRPSVTFHVRALTHDDAAIVDADGVLHGFFCVGAAARVPGLEPDPRFLDVGIGLDPSLVGKGWGNELGHVVTRHLNEVHPTRRLRAAVQSWNERSLKVARRLGFSEVFRHTSRGVEYTVLVVSP